MVHESFAAAAHVVHDKIQANAAFPESLFSAVRGPVVEIRECIVRQKPMCHCSRQDRCRLVLFRATVSAGTCRNC